ncbi:unnamed protein product [Bursaphelenchus okinawaensis]|uniref:Uncharacterized protein n=1 Tax=Bursaphelenchus okinawaensis TaxID=465554 RepID=A0A811KU32_9BILA|nr:unnamed protein product [Bursaphelenchus okinawaensis]CAG9112416.1 unnamed protein product [Bursaphelenchus okinawaensis]
MTPEEKAELEQKIREANKERESKRQDKQRMIVGASMVAAFFGSSAICLWQRRSDYRKGNEKLPHASFEEFAENYIKTNKVSAIIVQPNFKVMDVHLTKSKEEHFNVSTKQFLSTFATGPERYAIQPDLRVPFDGTIEQLQVAIAKAQEQIEGESQIKFEVNQFPSYKEGLFILISSTITLFLFGATQL